VYRLKISIRGRVIREFAWDPADLDRMATYLSLMLEEWQENGRGAIWATDHNDVVYLIKRWA
jgi:hypothetical protein